MLATKNLAPGLLAILLALLVFGCTPAGPQAMLTGRKLLESGDAAGAVEKFKRATSLMSSNAQAWNYLGLAAHQAGMPAESLVAYQQAIKLDRDLLEARFNLGCLLLDQGKTSLARDAFTACTVLRPAYTNAWLRLACCQLQLKELTAAETSLKELFRLNPQSAEGLNTLGLVQLQRNKPRDAAQSFSAALKSQPAHRAALLNLAITSHQQLNDRAAALTLYRQYLALTPRAADWDAVNSLAQSLQPPPAPVQSVPAEHNLPAPPRSGGGPGEVSTLATRNSPAKPIESPAPPTNTPAVKIAEIAPRQATNAKPAPTNLSPVHAPVVQATNPPAEVVRLPPEPVIRSAPVEDNPASAKPKSATVANPPPAPTKPVAESTSDKRGFLSRVNPANLFRKESKPVTNSAPPPVDDKTRVAIEPSVYDTAPPAVEPGTGGYPRYQYLTPARPASGNRNEAERLLAQGRREQNSQKMTEAVQSYRAAVAADPANFDAQFALGYASYQIRSYKLSTWAWEHALAIHPDSADARYNFALALRAMNCVPEAANELEKVLRADDTVTKAHLTLGSIYAEQLKNVAKARLHYRRVLDLEPSHPRGADIRQWLVSNKP